MLIWGGEWLFSSVERKIVINFSIDSYLIKLTYNTMYKYLYNTYLNITFKIENILTCRIFNC